MKKIIALVFLMLVASVANARYVECIAKGTCFYAPPGTTITADQSGKVSWSGVKVTTVVHFKQENKDGLGWLVGHPAGSATSVQLPNVAEQGGRFQLKYGDKWLLITPEDGVPFEAGGSAQLNGVQPICDDGRGCALGITGTRIKQGPQEE